MKPDEDVDRVLADATQVRASTTWPEPSDLRRIAGRRKRRFVGVTAAGVVAATAVAVAVYPNGSTHGVRVPQGLHVRARSGAAVELVANAKPLGADAKAADAVAQAEQAFSLALLRQTNKTAGLDNVVLSPSSLAIALSMLQTGAAGKTRDEIANVLHTSRLTSEQQDAGWATLTDELAAAGKRARISVQSANSLWLQQNLPMQPAFMTALARYFDAGTWQVDFQRNLPAAARAINAWVKTHTNGKITKLFDPGDIDPTTLLVLANAVYFKAAWQYRFDPKETAPLPFHRADGSTVSAPFMTSHGGGQVASTPAYSAVQLPYAGGRFAALAVMPKKQDLASFLSGLTVDGLARISNALAPQHIEVRLPRFTTTSYMRLNDTLKAMGMPTAFGGSADFSAMSPKGMQVQSAVQRDYLRVDEKGTEAAAVTGISVTDAAVTLPVMSFDRPFLFLVRDTKTGTIMFAAQVQNPAAP
jgi:serine protease inhibitor